MDSFEWDVNTVLYSKVGKTKPLVQLGILLIMLYYVWACLPVMQGYFGFFISEIYAVLFVGIYVVGILCFIISKKGSLHVSALLAFAVVYILAHLVFVLGGMVNTLGHFYRNFIFWSPLFTYVVLHSHRNERVFLTRFITLLILVTWVCTIVRVVGDSSAARQIARGGNEEESLSLYRMNVAGGTFFQVLVLLIPVLITLRGRLRHPVLALLAVVLIEYSLLQASFTIALLVSILAILLTQYINGNKVIATMILMLAVVIVFFLPWNQIISFIAANVGNKYIAIRLYQIAEFLQYDSLGINMQSRFNLYMRSLYTFSQSLIGIGPVYENMVGANGLGVGYHSQVFDDMARFGVFAIVAHVSLFCTYLRFLKRRWKVIGAESVALAVTIIFYVFLCLNLGQRTIYEGVMLFVILPTIPDMVLIPQNNRKGFS